jgi:hypothetical protein
MPSPDGRWLAAACLLPGNEKQSVALLEAGSAFGPKAVVRKLRGVVSLAFTGAPGTLVVSEVDGARAYRVDHEGSLAGPAPVWSVGRLDEAPRLDRSGASVSREDDALVLRPPLERRPSGSARIDLSDPARRSAAFEAVGFRALVRLGDSVASFLPTGAPLDLAPLPRAAADLAHKRWAVSPSGRLVALALASSTSLPEQGGRLRHLCIIDLRTGVSRQLALETTDGYRVELHELAWSPSGRKLAVTSAGESVLVWDAD